MPLANRQTKLAKTTASEQAVFRLYSLGVSTNRDEWVYDFDDDNLGKKVRVFVNGYEEVRAKHGGESVDIAELGVSIKWTRDLERQMRLDIPNVFNRTSIRRADRRPFVSKALYFNQQLNEMQYQMPQVFPSGSNNENRAICFPGNASSNGFQVLAVERVFSHDLLKTTQCLPLYRYTVDGERVSNITEWGLRQFREHYGNESISAEDIFGYTYAVLHAPEFREKYAVDLSREFPRLPFHDDFRAWASTGQELLDLHIGFESEEPYRLKREDSKAAPGKARLKADKERGLIVLDNKTTLSGVPEIAWKYRLGSRSAIEWVLDQYKEGKPKDPTIAAKFNTYRFADYKDRVIDLLGRVCTVSVRTMELIDSMPSRSCSTPVKSG